MKKEEIYDKKNVERLKQGRATTFLDRMQAHRIQSLCKKEGIPCHTFRLFPDCEKVILYRDTFPSIICYQIISNQVLRHSDILGALFSHQIEPFMYGDIVCMNEYCYLTLLREMKPYMESFFDTVGRNKVTLEEVDYHVIIHYTYPYQEIEIVVTSNRLDHILVKLSHLSPKRVKEKLSAEEVRCNFEVITKASKRILEGDTLSIRRVGKFRFVKEIGTTKKGNLILLFHRFL